MFDDSGVFLELPPFSHLVESVLLQTAVTVPLVQTGETLRTLLLGNPAALHDRETEG